MRIAAFLLLVLGARPATHPSPGWRSDCRFPRVHRGGVALQAADGRAKRQAGIIAVAGIFALRHHVSRIAKDDVNARRLAEGLCRLPGGVRFLSEATP